MNSTTALSLRALNDILPTATASRLMKKYGTVNMAIWCARVEYYVSLLGRQPKNDLPELIDALLANGYIRKDITPATFAIGRLYKKVVSRRKIEHDIPASVADLYRANAEEANRRYEQFVAPTQEQCDRLIGHIRALFQNVSDEHPGQSKAENVGRNVDIIRYWSGLSEDGMPHTAADTARRYGLCAQRVLGIVRFVSRRLAFHPFAIGCDGDIAQAIFAIEGLRPRDVPEDSPIVYVVGDGQLHRTLRRAGINTVSDLLSLFDPKSKKRVRNLGIKGKDRLRKRLEEAGYAFNKDGYLATEAELDELYGNTLLEPLEVIPWPSELEE